MPERRIWLRASFVAVAIIALVPTLPVVASAYLPDAPVLWNISRLIVPYLPQLIGLAILAAASSLAALRLGRQPLPRAVAAISFVTLVGVGFMTFQVVRFSLNYSAPISVTRLLGVDVAATPRADDLVTFATVDGQPLRAQLWRSPAPDALAMYVHGGSFTGGELGARPRFFRALADQGITVLDVEYRLAPPPRWDTAPGDVLCALGWLDGHAAELGSDPDHVLVIGDSAGGNLALMAGYAAGTDRLVPTCPTRTVAPFAVIAIEPAADLAGIWADMSVPGDAAGFPESYIGGTPNQYPERYAAASPLGLIRAGLPPTLLIAAEIDHLIRPARTTELGKRLFAAHVYCSILTVPYAEHGISRGPDDYGAQILESIVPDFVATVLGNGTPYGSECG
jgi:acetyl esterase/lipase